METRSMRSIRGNLCWDFSLSWDGKSRVFNHTNTFHRENPSTLQCIASIGTELSVRNFPYVALKLRSELYYGKRDKHIAFGGDWGNPPPFILHTGAEASRIYLSVVTFAGINSPDAILQPPTPRPHLPAC